MGSPPKNDITFSVLGYSDTGITTQYKHVVAFVTAIHFKVEYIHIL